MEGNDIILIPEYVTSALAELFRGIGYSDEDKRKIFHNLQDQLRRVCEDSIESVKRDKKMLIDSIESSKEQIEELRERMGFSPNSKVVKKLEGKSLMDQHDIITKNHTRLLEKKENIDRMINPLCVELSSLFEKLGIGEAKQRECFTNTYDLSGQRVEMLAEYIQELNGQLDELKATLNREKNEVFKLWGELGIPATTDFEKELLYSKKPKVSVAYLEDVLTYKQGLVNEKEKKVSAIEEKMEILERMWRQLSISEDERSYIRENCQSLADGEDLCNVELERLNELKGERVGEMLMFYKEEIHEVWNKLHKDPSEREQFLNSLSTDFTDEELCKIFEKEIALLEDLYESQKHVWEAIEVLEALLEEKIEFDESARRKSRLLHKKGNPGRLLHEERTRRRLQMDIPKYRHQVLKELRKYGQPFFYQGRNYEERLREKLREANVESNREKQKRDFRTLATPRAVPTPKPEARPRPRDVRSRTISTPMPTRAKPTPKSHRQTPRYKLGRRE